MNTRLAEGKAVHAAWRRAMCVSDKRPAVIRSLEFRLNERGCRENKYDMDEVRAWFAGVVPDVKAMLLEDYGSRKRAAAAFKGCGSLGSVWCDVSLTAHAKTKKTRLCLLGVRTRANLKGFIVMLDPTFDHTW